MHDSTYSVYTTIFYFTKYGMVFSSQANETVIQQLRDHNALYRAQVREMGSRLEQARRQGQEIAERKNSGEISVLREELGSKSK